MIVELQISSEQMFAHDEKTFPGLYIKHTLFSCISCPLLPSKPYFHGSAAFKSKWRVSSGLLGTLRKLRNLVLLSRQIRLLPGAYKCGFALRSAESLDCQAALWIVSNSM